MAHTNVHKPKRDVPRLVCINCKTLHYHAYDGKRHLNTISSDIPLEAEFVEYFRLHTDKVMADIDGPTEPEVA